MVAEPAAAHLANSRANPDSAWAGEQGGACLLWRPGHISYPEVAPGDLRVRGCHLHSRPWSGENGGPLQQLPTCLLHE